MNERTEPRIAVGFSFIFHKLLIDGKNVLEITWRTVYLRARFSDNNS